jgi:membrane protein DedA with SNARE-associated domain
MIEKVLNSLGFFIITVISASGYVGIALLMAIESACIPLPSEVIMPFSGYLVSTGRFNLILVATAGAIGCNIGSAVAYWIGSYGGRPMIQRFGKYVLLNTNDVDRATHYFNKFGGITVFVARLLPVVRTFIALPAGIAKMPQLRFHIYTFLGSWPWCFALAYVGVRLGQAWQTDPRLKHLMHRFDGVILGVLVIGFVWFVWTHWKHRSTENVADLKQS